MEREVGHSIRERLGRPGVDGLFLRAAVILALIVLVGLLVDGWPMGLSILLGGIAALVNFHWLRLAMDGVLLGKSERSPALLAAGFLGRLLLILVVLFAIIQLPFLSLFGALGGLAIFVAAGLIEAVLLLGRRQF